MSRRPTQKDIERQNAYLLRQQENLRKAGERTARELSEFPEVEKIALFGSVSRPLEKEIPRFSEYRRAGIAVYHECKDVDLAVWVRDLSRVREMGKSRTKAVNDLLAEDRIGIAHHQVDIFLIEPGTNRYLGRVCNFNQCPKARKNECLVPGCGDTPFVRQHAEFTFEADALSPDRSIILFDRSAETPAL
ncbi:hypothetical protein Mal4_02960 [Maioricimonas rarisocia]|uniref:Uncharacterized protein n=1 Tax=Maioricimonas rarisocia TaxID=2528026 RepID=A0A517Z0M0_9PLAN|nr:hypothetical protein [Maioricimonas rarisocia]QDU36013.1 hypothetical protein Mal4_02960 [Maioricimonas rarisocia]